MTGTINRGLHQIKRYFQFLQTFGLRPQNAGMEARKLTKLAERLGGAVRRRRKAHSMTQAALGDAVGLSEEWVRRIERGTGAPSFETLEALAGAFRCSVAELFEPLSTREAASARIETLLAGVPDDDLPWLEELIRVAARHSTRHNS